MIRRLQKIDSMLFFSRVFQFGFCPAGCRDGMGGPLGHVYRSSRRSLTLQCTKCRLVWTMTVHQIAKAAQRFADQRPEDAMLQHWAALWASWAAGVNDRRGRRRTDSDTPTSETPRPEQSGE